MPNTAPMVLPQYQGNYYDLQNRQALAQALMGQATQNQASLIPTNMPVMPKYSIGAGLTQLGQAYLAAKLQQSASQGLSNLGQQQMAYLAGGGAPAQATAQQQAPQTGSTPNPFAGDQGGAPAGATQTGTPSTAAPSGGGLLAPGSAMNPSGMDPSKAAYLYYTLGAEKYSEQYVAPYMKPTDATLMARAAGVDPAAANAGALFHANYVAPNQGTPGTIARDPRTNQPMYYSPAIPEGGEPVFNAGGQVVGVKGLDGSLKLIGDVQAAKTAGEGSELPYDKGVDAAGNPLPVTNRTQAATGNLPLPLRNNNPGAVSPGGSVAQYPDMQTGIKAMDNNLASYAGKKDAGTLGQVITKWVGSPENAPAYIKDVTSRLGISANTPVDLTNPAQRLAISSAIMLHENGAAAVFRGGQGGAAPQQQSATPAGTAIYAAPPMGAATSADTAARGQQEDLAKKWTDLVSQNQQAQGVIANLQNIKTLAGKAAVGPQADRLNYINGLLSLAGSEKAQSMVDANTLLDKNSNQIIAKLSQGGMGTDAARSILQSAYPNSHMQQGAINEAADNLVGAQQMVQAKARLLAPYRTKNDATGYTNTELQFDQNADPRIFQYANIKDPAARKAFAQNLVQQDPTIVQKIQTLQSLGALK